MKKSTGGAYVKDMLYEQDIRRLSVLNKNKLIH